MNILDELDDFINKTCIVKRNKKSLVGLTQFLSPNIAQTLSVRGKNQYDY